MNEESMTTVVGRVLNLGRGDLVINKTDQLAGVEVNGIGTLFIPPHGEIVLPRKGVSIEGNWRCGFVLMGSHIGLTLEERLDEGHQEAKE